MSLDVSGRLIVGMIVEESDFWTKAKEDKLSCARCLRPGSGNFCSACGGKLSIVHAREATPALIGLSRTGEAAEGAWERLLDASVGAVGADKTGIHFAESVIDGRERHRWRQRPWSCAGLWFSPRGHRKPPLPAPAQPPFGSLD